MKNRLNSKRTPINSGYFSSFGVKASFIKGTVSCIMGQLQFKSICKKSKKACSTLNVKVDRAIGLISS